MQNNFTSQGQSRLAFFNTKRINDWVNRLETQPELTSHHPSPEFHELAFVPEVTEAFQNFATQEKCLLLDSSRQVKTAQGESLGRYSFLSANPTQWIDVSVDSKEPFANAAEVLESFAASRIDELPPFQGGLAGVISYDFNRSLERIPATPSSQFPFPALALGLYDTVIAWDHVQQRCWIISHGISDDGLPCKATAQKRISEFKRILESKEVFEQPFQGTTEAPPLGFVGLKGGPAGLLSNFSKPEYIAAVEKAIEYIYSGDVFQINLAQQLLSPAKCSSSVLYERLRRCNPAPFGGYFDLGDSQVISASPERLISVRDRLVETRPIKGTRKRTRFPQVDLHAQQELKNSEKDLAENTMIVDLMRNDLSRVCSDDSICVRQFCEIEQYESVLHLVSAVQGKLRPEVSTVELLKAVFPGGSITGAPKVRAMEIIAELEPTARAAYCGSLGYIGFDGTVDFNILIRTITSSQGWWQIPVGGGIVSQSNPQSEYEETWTKAAGMLRALRP